MERGVGAIKALEDRIESLDDKINAFQQVLQAGEDMRQLMGEIFNRLPQERRFDMRASMPLPATQYST